ncbi:MAG: hypothetical protein J2P27_02155 [Actinobacteria bacterium]|nr:hypothetical protein [Actinomycetota bacterium]
MAIDEYADTARAAAFLGYKPLSITRKIQGTRADGKPALVIANARFSRSPVRNYRTLVLYKASPRSEAPCSVRVGKFRDAVALSQR